jgi:hypothetical protein
MGALGGIVRLVRSYLAPGIDDPRLRDYIFIPVIGMVVAIGGYVLAKTGLLLLSSAKEETALSPFMVGLVGIISGLLAKEVIDRITDVGVPMLRGQKGNNAQANAPRAGDRRAIRAPEASLGANPADASPDQAGGSEVMSDDGQ